LLGQIHPRPGIVYGDAHIAHRLGQHLRQIDRTHRPFMAANAGILQQIQDQTVHALGAVAGKTDESAGVVVKSGGIAALQQRHIAGHLPQRLAQIV